MTNHLQQANKDLQVVENQIGHDKMSSCVQCAMFILIEN